MRRTKNYSFVPPNAREILHRRIHMGISHRECARRACLDETDYLRIELGVRKWINFKEAHVLSQVLGCNINDIILLVAY